MKHYVLQYLAPERLITLFKCFIYTGLCINGYQFISDDLAAADQLLSGASSLSDIVNTFAVTMDTLAWISLLVVFELETWVLDDKTIKLKRVKWSLNFFTAICYMFIIYAFVGYAGKLIMLLDSVPFVGNPCDLVNTSSVIITTLDEYHPITAESCQLLNPATMGQIANQPIVFENSAYGEIKILAWIDLINSATWLLIVVLLQVDIMLQLRGILNKHIMRVTGVFKAILYSTLFIMAVFWGIYGSFTDFFDAVLWLLGFLIIELNIFNWNQEVAEEQAQAASQAS
ncbi:hypothetical protein NO559_06790 [Dasania sp. GY-MA-18]|uniref:Shikimate kinase n=1 Tax=Dasania phycosphaerae TaxID=2950436 RepID=A0A9J6RKG9_9GAMM|nr:MULTISPECIES: hypothetical protein [Dasania]MCR8922472.1 hypothetical protein [Dasania sp. GY-MA-18]MCZ0864900.1 hypothetical protein [Dasania phycosphaerae]MCZ0868628.1 hypothetical protein [Dasania phycosphaerae]